MSVPRFIGYFIALSACSTIAFASSLVGRADPPEAQDAEMALPPLPVPPSFIPLHGHKNGLKHLQVAQAE